MRTAVLCCFVLIGVCGTLTTAAAAQSSSETEITPPADSVRIVLTELEPFVDNDDGRPDGFYAEIWAAVALELGVTYEFVWADSFGELLDTVERGDAEVAVAPLAPTAARETRFDFSSAVISSGPQLGFHERMVADRSILSTLFSPSVRQILLVAVLGLVILAHLIWIVERGRDDEEGSDFRQEYLPGIWDGFWWATVTVTTVGYGDKAPRSFGGRAIALLAMLLSLFLVGAFVSQITDILAEQRTAAPIEGLDDARDHPVGVVGGSTFADYVNGEGLETVAFDSQAALFEAVEAGEIDVMVTNPFALSAIGPEHGVRPAGTVLYEEFETFGLAQGSPWREPINQALADLQASGEIEEIIDRWMN
ncbi:MAG: transporter substrate-binding domain-containing protein [Actinomycetota bacterium]